MFDMGFDIYAMVKPKTKADYAALMEEALAMSELLNEQLDDVFEKCAAARAQAQGTDVAEDLSTMLIECEGIQLSPLSWAELLDIPFQLLHARMMKLGWSYENAIADELRRKQFKKD